jgi:hypothetical protein
MKVGRENTAKAFKNNLMFAELLMFDVLSKISEKITGTLRNLKLFYQSKFSLALCKLKLCKL